MDLKKLGLFKLIGDKMSWHNQRQEVLAHNIANADTPEFRPRDLVGFDFKRALKETSHLPMASTHPSHLPGPRPAKEGFRDRDKGTYETAPAGNAVVLEEQMMKVGQNAMEYQTITNLYRK